MKAIRKDEYQLGDPKITPYLVGVTNQAGAVMQDTKSEPEVSLLDALSSSVDMKSNIPSKEQDIAIRNPKNGLGKSLAIGAVALFLAIAGLAGAHFYFGEDNTTKIDRNSQLQGQQNNPSTLAANIDALNSDSGMYSPDGNIHGKSQSKPNEPSVISTPTPDSSAVSTPLEFSDPNSIVINEMDLSKNVDPYVSALQAMPDASQAELAQPVEPGTSTENSESNRGKIIDVMQGVDIQGLVNSHMRRVDASLSEHDVKIDGTQKAVTQTAQLIVELRNTIQAIKKDVVQLRAVVFDNQDSIKVLTQKLEQAQAVRTSNTSEPKPVSTGVEAVKSTGVSIDQRRSSPVSATASDTTIRMKKPTIELSNFKVNATVDNRAAISNTDGKTFALVKGERYTNLGRVIEFDATTNDVYGEFDNGKSWVIRGIR